MDSKDLKKENLPEQQQEIPGSETEMDPKPIIIHEDYEGSNKLRGKTALITGGDSGIGRAVAVHYAREGANVAIVYLEEDRDAEITEELIIKEGSKCLLLKGDLRNKSFCKQCVDETMMRFGDLNILVNNAGVQRTYENFLEAPESEVREVFETNIDGLLHFCRAALPLIPAGGCIINTTSIQAFKPSPTLAPYASTKAAIPRSAMSGWVSRS